MAMTRLLICMTLTSGFLFPPVAPVMAQATQGDIDLVEMTLEELANIEITSVSRQRESLSRAPASIYVITAEDIRRSGATSIPEVLRLAPNLQVARRDAFQYSITARGFNNAVGNKLLVLLDGRTIYTPLFSGVFWEMQDTVMADIDRVEVISGPGATLWGANAVNGVINIITKESDETTAPLLVADAGNRERGGAARVGGSYAGIGTFRIFGKYREWDHTRLANDSDVKDAWKKGQIGFRSDLKAGDNQLTFEGDAYRGESEHRGFVGALEIPSIEVSGMNLLARWTRDLGNDSHLMLQAYWTHSERKDFVLFQPKDDIFDLEFQHSIPLAKQRILWGGGYRYAKDDIEPGFFSSYIPDSEQLDWQNIYIQDEIQLNQDLEATLGIKLERNDFTGWEYLPSLRLAWSLAENRLLWAGVSRAVRAPSRFDRNVFFPENPPFIVAGGPDFQSEVAHVIEGGFRDHPLSNLNYSVTLYYHDWDKLRSGTGLPLPIMLVNNIEGEAYGIEAWATWQAASFWRISGGVNAMDKNLRVKPGTSVDTVGVNNNTLHNDPDYQWNVRSSFDLPADIQLDLLLRRVDELVVQPVPAYTELDVRLAWYAMRNLELSVTGYNLLHRSHAEFGGIAFRGEFQRSVLFGLKWTF